MKIADMSDEALVMHMRCESARAYLTASIRAHQAMGDFGEFTSKYVTEILQGALYLIEPPLRLNAGATPGEGEGGGRG